MNSRTPRTRFDANYYRRFYGTDPVHTKEQVAHLACAVFSMAKWWQIDVRSVLDVGAGPGYWRDWFVANQPGLRYQSIDVSAHACRSYGHERRDIVTWHAEVPAEIVICQGVLHYLDDTSASSAITNLAASSGAVLYLEVPVLEDLEATIDPAISDLKAYWRPASWYRRQLRRHFDQAGAGMWVRKSSVTLYCLEGATP